jgi:hypothetical protein
MRKVKINRREPIHVLDCGVFKFDEGDKFLRELRRKLMEFWYQCLQQTRIEEHVALRLPPSWHQPVDGMGLPLGWLGRLAPHAAAWAALPIFRDSIGLQRATSTPTAAALSKIVISANEIGQGFRAPQNS